jgi:hypothetical protein
MNVGLVLHLIIWTYTLVGLIPGLRTAMCNGKSQFTFYVCLLTSRVIDTITKLLAKTCLVVRVNKLNINEIPSERNRFFGCFYLRLQRIISGRNGMKH